jgi:hypothetical protein
LALTSATGHERLGGASCRSSNVRNAPLATVGLKKAACREGPTTDMLASVSQLTACRRTKFSEFSSGDHFDNLLCLRRKLAILLCMEAICLVVIQLRSTQFSPLGQTQQGNGESHQRHNKENGNANLVLNVHEGACKRHDYENSYRDTADRARGRL